MMIEIMVIGHGNDLETGMHCYLQKNAIWTSFEMNTLQNIDWNITILSRVKQWGS